MVTVMTSPPSTISAPHASHFFDLDERVSIIVAVISTTMVKWMTRFLHFFPFHERCLDDGLLDAPYEMNEQVRHDVAGVNDSLCYHL